MLRSILNKGEAMKMAFVPVDHWQGRAHPALPGYRPLILPYSRPAWLIVAERFAKRWQLERPVTLVISCLIVAVVIAALAGLTRLVPPAPVDRFPLVLLLVEPRTSSEGSAGSAAAPVPQVAKAPVPPSPADTSTPTPVSRSEWSVSRIPMLGSQRDGEISASGIQGAGTAGAAGGVGSGRAGAYDPYAGASPRGRAAPSTRPDGIDERQLEIAIADVKRRYPRARGAIDLRLRLSPGGMVLDVTFVSPITPKLAAAIKAALIGRPMAPAEDGSIGGTVMERLVEDVVIG